MVDWSGVRARVSALADDPRAHQLFGANGHGFRLRATLSEADLAEAEAQFGVRLPEEYRGFLREVGAGGAGPFYGVFPLVRTGGSWRWEGDGAELTGLDRLVEEFPRTGADPEALAALLAACPENDEDAVEGAEYDARYEAWYERLGELLWNPDRTAGAICLCHEGCAYRRWLVVSGPERGTIWDDARTANEDLKPNRTTFAAWYLDWLAEQEAAARRT
jgi:hypothetical protein